MSVQSLLRLGGLANILAAALFIIGGILTAVTPDGGLGRPASPLAYYLGLVVAVPALMGLFGAYSGRTGKLGLAGFLLAILGAILYSAPVFVLLAGTSGVGSWHDLWGFAMGNTLPLGASAFLIGLILLGAALLRLRSLPRPALLLLVVGAFLWLVAFWLSVVPFMLTLANLLAGAGMIWLGWSLFAPGAAQAAALQQAQG